MKSLMMLSSLFLSIAAWSATPIVGGTSVGASDAIAHTVLALVATNNTSQALCTASLVAPDLVITAAHCVWDGGPVTPTMYTLIFGLSLRAQGNALRTVDRIEIPKEWNPNSPQDKDTSDVALLHFSGGTPVGFVPADLLPFNQALNPGQSVVLAGYGITDANADSGEGTLRKTAVTVMNQNYSPTEIELDQSHGGGACHGDSGGPAYLLIGGRPYLFGITSRGGGACNEDVIYSKISAYATWFQDAVAAIRR